VVKSGPMRMISGLRLSCVFGMLGGLAMIGACGDDGGTQPGDDLFPAKPECTGESIVPYAGSNPQVISKLEIGTAMDGFDLDHDGKPDNKLAAVASLAGSAIADSLKAYDIVIPIEMFDLQGAAPDTCVKFAIYLGDYVVDKDGDGEDPFVEGGDCNDNDPNIEKDHAEVPGNGKDDDCDALADEDEQNMPSTNTADADGDGVTIAAGDCDDTNNMIKPGLAEICGDGLDNDCDGVADRTQDASGNATACSPYGGTADIPLDPLSFKPGTMEPVITFTSGEIVSEGGKLVLHAGPSLFSVAIPVTDGITLDLRISGATIEGDVVTENNTVVIKNARLGGVIDAKTADTIRGLKVDEIGLTPENSLLDAVFANLLGPLLALPKSAKSITDKYNGCRTPDIDVDGDGLESFCDSDPDDDVKVVDVCIDGDGTEVKDVAGMECSEAVKNGKNRFVDGISVALKFETTSIGSIQAPR
jgi:hypothetical protein